MSEMTNEMLTIDLENAEDDMQVLFAQCDMAEQDVRDAEAKLVEARQQHGADSIQYQARHNAVKTMAKRWQDTINQMDECSKRIDSIKASIRSTR